jgi:hypothetical protein
MEEAMADPHVVTALRARRAELAGEIEIAHIPSSMVYEPHHDHIWPSRQARICRASTSAPVIEVVRLWL